jgi:hypothetical protein
MGGVLVRKAIYDAFMKGPEHVIELFHVATRKDNFRTQRILRVAGTFRISD